MSHGNKKKQDKYLQDFVVDLRNIFLSLHLDDIFLDLDLKHCLLSVRIGHGLERKPDQIMKMNFYC